MGNIIKSNNSSSLEEEEENSIGAAGGAAVASSQTYHSDGDHESSGVDVQPPVGDCHSVNNATVTQHVQPPVDDCHSAGSVQSTQHGASFNHSYTSPFSPAHSVKQLSDPAHKKNESKPSAGVNGYCQILSPKEMNPTQKKGSSGSACRKRDHRSLDRHQYSPYKMSNHGLPLKNPRYSLGYMPVIKLNPVLRHAASLSSPRSATVHIPSPNKVHTPSRKITSGTSSQPGTSSQQSTPSTSEVIKALEEKMPNKRKREDNSSPVTMQQNQIQQEVRDENGVVKKRRVMQEVQTPKVGVDEIMEEVFNRTILKKGGDLRSLKKGSEPRCNRSLNAIDSSYTSSRLAEMLRKHNESLSESRASTPSFSRISADTAHSDIDDSNSTASESKVHVKPLHSQLKPSTNQSQEWFPTVPKHSTIQGVQSPAGQSTNTRIKLHFPMEPPLSGFWATPSDVAADKARDEKRLRKLLDISDEETIPKSASASVKPELVMPIQCPAVMPEGMTVKLASTDVKQPETSISVQSTGDSNLGQKQLGSMIACVVSTPTTTASLALSVAVSAPISTTSAGFVDGTAKSTNLESVKIVATNLADTSVNLNSTASGNPRPSNNSTASGNPHFHAEQQAAAVTSKPNVDFNLQTTTASPGEAPSNPSVNFGLQAAVSTASNPFGFFAGPQNDTLTNKVNAVQPTTSASILSVPNFSFGQQITTTTTAVVPNANTGQQTTTAKTSSGPGLIFGQQSTASTASNVPSFTFGQTNTTSSTAGGTMNFSIVQPAATAKTSTLCSLNSEQQTTTDSASNTSGFSFGQPPKTAAVSSGYGLGFSSQATTSLASTVPSFTFGQQTTASTTSGNVTNYSIGQPVTTSSATGFSFGQQTSTTASGIPMPATGATALRASSCNFGQAGASTTGSHTGSVFGQQATAMTSSNIPNFNIGQQTATATTSTGPSFSFGQQTTTTAASNKSSFVFGQQASTTRSSTPNFSFGQQSKASAAPSFNLGQQASSTTATDVPSFTFGQAVTPAGAGNNSGFNFGQQTTYSSTPSFNFGQQSSSAMTLPTTTTTVFGQASGSSGFPFGVNQPLTNGSAFSGTGFGGSSTNPSPAFGASTSVFGGDKSNLFTTGGPGSAFKGTPATNQFNATGFGGTTNGFMSAGVSGGSSTNPPPAFGTFPSAPGEDKSNPFANSGPTNAFGGGFMPSLPNVGFGGASNGLFNPNTNNNGTASPAAPMFSMGSSSGASRRGRKKR